MNFESPIRIAIGGDQRLFCCGLSLLLQRHGFTIVSNSDSAELLDIVAHSHPEVAILNLFTVDSNKLQLAMELHQLSPQTAAIVISDDSGEEGIYGATDYVAGYVPRSESEDVLIAAISKVAHGGIYLCQGWRSDKKALSQREEEVFRFIAEGLRPKEIGALLGLSAKTVEAHRSKIMNKLQIRETAQLVRYALRHGLMST
jgi:two-component system, NarL family, response regulator NreC